MAPTSQGYPTQKKALKNKWFLSDSCQSDSDRVAPARVAPTRASTPPPPGLPPPLEGSCYLRTLITVLITLLILPLGSFLGVIPMISKGYKPSYKWFLSPMNLQAGLPPPELPPPGLAAGVCPPALPPPGCPCQGLRQGAGLPRQGCPRQGCPCQGCPRQGCPRLPQYCRHQGCPQLSPPGCRVALARLPWQGCRCPGRVAPARVAPRHGLAMGLRVS